MPRLTIYTYTPMAGKVTYKLTGPVGFRPIGGSEGTPPGVIFEDGNPPEPVAYVSAQAFGMALIDDERLISVERPQAIPASDKEE